MPEVVKSPAMILMALVVLIILVFFIFEIFNVKIGRIVCNVTGRLILGVLYNGIFSGFTPAGVEATCNLMFF